MCFVCLVYSSEHVYPLVSWANFNISVWRGGTKSCIVMIPPSFLKSIYYHWSACDRRTPPRSHCERVLHQSRSSILWVGQNMKRLNLFASSFIGIFNVRPWPTLSSCKAAHQLSKVSRVPSPGSAFVSVQFKTPPIIEWCRWSSGTINSSLMTASYVLYTSQYPNKSVM